MSEPNLSTRYILTVDSSLFLICWCVRLVFSMMLYLRCFLHYYSLKSLKKRAPSWRDIPLQWILFLKSMCTVLFLKKKILKQIFSWPEYLASKFHMCIYSHCVRNWVEQRFPGYVIIFQVAFFRNLWAVCTPANVKEIL